ncbi:hypothetical protein ACLFMI_10295 [Pseudonocardia nantongensis]|uniref:hypothetical protein n=1 Tax=Pseudonocardia nantongensis TaxID=1181885 RepID=UPI0039799EC3
MTHAASPATSSTTPIVVGVRALAVLTVANLAWQFVTAAGLFTGGGAGAHGTGAIVLHVVTGLLALALVAHRLVAGGPVWPAALAVVVFGLTFLQASYGSIPGLIVHLPGALILTTGSVWLAAWSFLRLR